MARRSVQDHKLLIISLYRRGSSEEEIAEQLCKVDIETTFSEIQQYLETWHVIPCPSPVHSKDTDIQSDRPQQTSHHKLGVTCHHGETSHISEISLANIASDATPVEKYQQDKQPHEELALKLQLSEEERVRRTVLLVDDPVVDELSALDGDALVETVKRMKNDRERIGSRTASTTPRLRKRPGNVRKRV